MAGSKGLSKLSGKTGVLLWLMVLYSGLTYLAVGTISVSQIKSRFGDQSSYIFHIADIAEQQRRAIDAQLKATDEELFHAQSRRDAAMVELNAQAQRLGVPFGRLQTALDDPDAAVRLSDFEVGADAETNAHWDGTVSEYYRQAIRSKFLNERHHRLVSELRDSLAKLMAGNTIDGKIMGGISESVFQSAISAAAGLRSFGYAWLFAIPPEVLTMLLALVLGALGSALHMTRVLTDGEENPPFCWYLFRPCQGLLVALAVFVLLKAGQLTVGTSDTDSLSPFFVAFVGTMSGLLAPDAYRLLQRTGATLIPAASDGAERWAFGLGAAMEAAGVDAAALAAGIGARPEEVAAWVAELHPVPEIQQRLMAAWLHADCRRLFTIDQPPARPLPPPSAALLPQQGVQGA